MDLGGRVWIDRDEKSLLGEGRVNLLMKIDEFGSISKAAKEMKMSYKKAWDSVDLMNNLSPKPIVTTATGGRGGGGTHLTPYGKEVIRKFKVIQEEHRKFLSNLSKRLDDSSSIFRLYERISMKISARNQLLGVVEEIKRGKINSEVILSLQGEDKITAIVTNEAVKELAIKVGVELYAIIKSSSILIAKAGELKISSRNRVLGEISYIKDGEVNVQIGLKLKGGNSIGATVTKDAKEELNLSRGDRVYAIFKASSVILGVQ